MTMQNRSIMLDVQAVLSRFDPNNMRSRYQTLLMVENRRINLVSRETSLESLDRLTAESLLPLSCLERRFGRYLDIGSGGGIPALPIILALQTLKRICLVERTKKKSAAIRRILLGLSLKAEIAATQFEETSFCAEFDLVTMRLVKLTPTLLTKILTALEPGGCFVYYAIPDFQCDTCSAVTYSYSSANSNSSGSFTIFNKN